LGDKAIVFLYGKDKIVCPLAEIMNSWALLDSQLWVTMTYAIVNKSLRGPINCT